MTSNTCPVCFKLCGIGENLRPLKYCSKSCRDKHNRQKIVLSGYVREYQRAKASKLAQEPSTFKKRCGICERWYKRVMAHIWQIHGLSAVEYKQYMYLPTSLGILTDDARQHLHDIVKSNGIAQSLAIKGQKTRFKKGHTIPSPNAGKYFPHSEYF